LNSRFAAPEVTIPLNKAMAANLVILLILLAFAANAQSVSGKQALPKFMGREVTVTDPGTDEDGFFPKGPATVCVEGAPQRQCYTMPKDFGRSAEVTLVQVEKGVPALLFSAESGGVCGWEIHFALLHQRPGKELEDLFLSNVSIPNQSEHEVWNLPDLFDAPIFMTAAYVWGPDEGHYDLHRFIVSTYARGRSSLLDGLSYYLEDQYMTTRKYDLEKEHILSSEKPEILARLRRVKAETQRQQRTP
jgi:hypothetical protein